MVSENKNNSGFNDRCPNCGGAILGDGCTIPRHCEQVDITQLFIEPDVDVVYCAESDGDEVFV